MSDLNNLKTKNELLAELDTAKASYDSAKIGELEAQIKKIEEQWEIHKEEMTEETQAAKQEKTMKMEELTNLLKDKPENAEKNTETIIEQVKGRILQTVEKFTSKIKELKGANESEKDKLNNELKTIKEDLRKTRAEYETTKNAFYGPMKYNFETMTKEDLAKISTRMYRFKTREGKLFNKPVLTKMKTIRRNMTIRTLIKKFNKMGDDPKKGVRFVLGFEKARFLRYTGIKVSSAIDKAWWAMRMQMNPQDFHARFNTGRNAIFSLLDADTGDEKTEGEKKVIQAIKDRINYYGATYARERANARVAPFVEAEKNAPKEAKIIQMNTSKEVPLANAA